eukprot:4814849-Amphidinium_carterae.3
MTTYGQRTQIDTGDTYFSVLSTTPPSSSSYMMTSRGLVKRVALFPAPSLMNHVALAASHDDISGHLSAS